MSPFSSFDMKRRWTEKHTPLTLQGQKMTNVLYTIDLPACISNKEKGNVSFFLIRYETALDRKIYTIMRLRPKNDKRYILLIYLHAFRIRKKGNVSVFLIRYETALDRKIYILMLLRPKNEKCSLYY